MNSTQEKPKQPKPEIKTGPIGNRMTNRQAMLISAMAMILARTNEKDKT